MNHSHSEIVASNLSSFHSQLHTNQFGIVFVYTTNKSRTWNLLHINENKIYFSANATLPVQCLRVAYYLNEINTTWSKLKWVLL